MPVGIVASQRLAISAGSGFRREDRVDVCARARPLSPIQGHLPELYGLEVSPDLISTVTDAVLETVAESPTGRWNRCIR